jgi:error-prone DNA polymerase
MADPPGEHLIVLAQGPVGYARLAKAISEAQLAGEKGAPRTSLAQLADAARAPVHGHGPARDNDHWFVLTGCRKGTVPAALVRDGPAAAEHALDAGRRVRARPGARRALGPRRSRSTGTATTRSRRSRCAPGSRWSRPTTCTTPRPPGARSRPRSPRCAPAVRSTRSTAGCRPAPFAHLRSAAEQLRRFARWPGAVERTVEIARACAFDLKLAAPNLPDYPVPDGHDEMSWLRELVRRGAAVFYPDPHPQHAKAMRRSSTSSP